MKFAIASVSYWDSIGMDSTKWRKSLDGTKALCHLSYAERLGINLYATPEVAIYDNVDTEFEELLNSPEWSGTTATGDPDSFSILNELNRFETKINTAVSQKTTETTNLLSPKIEANKQDLLAAKTQLEQKTEKNKQDIAKTDTKLEGYITTNDKDKLSLTAQLQQNEQYSINEKMNMKEYISHRGFSGISPENTILSFEYAKKYGFDSIEFDIQISSDGTPVVIHDLTVNRTTNGVGEVKNLTLAEIKSLDAGTWYGPNYSGSRIPTLKETLDICKGKKIYPEIKGYRTVADIETIVDLIVENGFEYNCVLQTVNYSDFVKVRELNKNITLGWLAGSSEVEFTNILGEAENDGNSVIVCQYELLLTYPYLVKLAKSKGVDVVAWTPDTTDSISDLNKIGVYKVMSNKIRGGF